MAKKMFLTGSVFDNDGDVTVGDTYIEAWLSKHFDGKRVNITVEEEEE